MKKVAIFAFKGELMCFVHVLLNALDMKEKGMDVKIVIEGEAVTLIEKLETSDNPMYQKAKELGLIDCICKACSVKLGVLEYNQNCGIPLNGDMKGHVAMSDYISKGYDVITL